MPPTPRDRSEASARMPLLEPRIKEVRLLWLLVRLVVAALVVVFVWGGWLLLCDCGAAHCGSDSCLLCHPPLLLPLPDLVA